MTLRRKCSAEMFIVFSQTWINIRHNTAEEELNKLHVFGRGSEVQRKFVDIIHEDTFYTYLAFSIVVRIRETRSGGI